MAAAYVADLETKRCYKCRLNKPLSEFSKNSRNRNRPSDDGYQSECKACQNLMKRGKPRSRGKPNKRPSVEQAMLDRAKHRARKLGLPCDITIEDVVVPELCPVLGVQLLRSTGVSSPNSPALDRIVPCLGYVRGNVQVISLRANAMKSDATSAELLRFARWVFDNVDR